jgi:nucleoside-diphosphate-sugar epimerase
VVYLSSDAVYGDDASNPVTEETPCRPVDLYGVMHLAREGMMRHVCSTAGTSLAILRPSIVYGPGDTHGSYGPNKWFRAVRSGKDIIVFGSGEEQRDHVFIDDAVSLVEAVLRHRSEGVLNVVTGTSPSFADVARAFREVTGVTRTTSRPRSVPVTHRTYDATAVRMAFPGFVPTTVHEGLRRTWTAEAEHQ